MFRDDRTAIAEFGAELSFDTGEGTLDSVLDTLDGIHDQLDGNLVEAEPRESIGSVPDDEFNAFLEVYDGPRREAEGGPLDGLSFAVKDCIAVEGLRMTCGVADFSQVPAYDAAAVERLLDAGGELVGKTNMEPFAFGPTGERSEFGPVTNPVAEDRVPGGSSSGSGAAVAAGLVDFALGTDTGGSVRLPAACCGVVGVKPTHGLVPRHGFVDLVPWTDAIGPLARDVDTAAAVLETMAGHDRRDPSSSHVDVGSLTAGLDDPGDLTVGVAESLVEASEDEVADVVAGVGDALAGTDGVAVEGLSIDLSDISKVYPLLVGEFGWLVRQRGIVRGQGTGYEEGFRAAISEYVEDHGFNEYVSSRALPAAYVDRETGGRSYVTLRRRAIAFREQLDGVFEDVDVLLTPTTRILPPEYGAIGVYENSLGVTGNTVPFSLAGTPAVTVPVGDVEGVPVGAQVVAPEFEDGLALRAAKLIETLTAG